MSHGNIFVVDARTLIEKQKRISSAKGGILKRMESFNGTRSCAALRAADLDWIVGPEYSLGEYIFGDSQLTFMTQHEKVIIFRQ